MLKIEIKTPMPKGCALEGIEKLAKKAVIEVEGFLETENLIKGLIKVKADEVDSLLKDLPEFCVSLKISKDSVRLLLREHPCLIAQPILSSGGIIVGLSHDGNSITWSIICDEKDCARLIKKLEELGVDFELVYKGRPEDKESMTFREEEILRTALEKGFFDYPKRIKLEELAKIFNISPSTLSEILRRAQKKVLERYFKGL
ncbi:MAG: helix-turn-helix domain-containing protein [Archaeoglobaceae archaeon]